MSFLWTRVLLAHFVVSVGCLVAANAEAESGTHRRQLLVSKIETDGDLVTVPVQVFDQDLRFVIDTGSTTTTLDERYRASLTPTEPKTPLENAIIEAGDSLYKSPAIIICGTEKGRVPFPNDLPVITKDFTKLRRLSSREFQGVLGMDFLGTYAVEFDLHRGQFALMNSEDAAPQQKDRTIGFETVARRAVVDLVSPGLAYWGLIDTGAVLTLDLEEEAYSDLFRRQELRRFATTVGPDNKLAYTSAAKLHGVQMGPFVHFGLVVGRHDVTLLGLHYWRRFHCVFDFPREKMYLKPSPYFGLRDEGDRCGIALQEDTPPGELKQIRVVLQDSIAEGHGVRAGDSLVSVDGIDTRDLTTLQVYLRIKLRSKKLTIVTKRGEGPEREVILPPPVESVPAAVVMDARPN